MYILNGSNYKQFDLIKSVDKNPTPIFMKLGEKITLFMKVTGCLLVCSFRSAGPILFSFTIKLVGAGKTILGEGSSPPPLKENPKEITPRKNPEHFFPFLLKSKCKMEGRPSTPYCCNSNSSYRLLGTKPLVTIIILFIFSLFPWLQTGRINVRHKLSTSQLINVFLWFTNYSE